MRTLKAAFVIAAGLTTASCAGITTEQTMALAASAVQAVTLSPEQIALTAQKSALQMDTQNQVAPSTNSYAKRLAKIVNGYENYDGLSLNFKVYLDDTVNAFAMPDGTVRVYSGLMDAMPDDQVLAVIGHEIGHVKYKHSYAQMKKQILTNTAFQALQTAGGTVAELTKGQLGQIGAAYLSAQFSQRDELESDQFAVKFLASQGKDPRAMRRSIETLSKLGGGDADFLSSHPSHSRRLQEIDAAISKLGL